MHCNNGGVGARVSVCTVVVCERAAHGEDGAGITYLACPRTVMVQLLRVTWHHCAACERAARELLHHSSCPVFNPYLLHTAATPSAVQRPISSMHHADTCNHTNQEECTVVSATVRLPVTAAALFTAVIDTNARLNVIQMWPHDAWVTARNQRESQQTFYKRRHKQQSVAWSC